MKITFLFKPGRAARLERARRGDLPTEFFYGGLELAARGHDVRLLDVSYEHPPTMAHRVLNLMFRWQLLPSRVYGGLLLNVAAMRRDLNECDVLVGTAPGIAFSLALLRVLGLIKPPIVGIQLGLLEHAHALPRRIANGILLRTMDSVLFGAAERAQMQETYRLATEQPHVVQFGVDGRFWHPGRESSEDYVLSVGNDGRRDYELLVRAAARVPRRFILVTQTRLTGPMPDNVEVRRGSWHEETLSDAELRELYRNALCVVIPLKESMQPSGQSVCLQAMACGRPVILTRTAGLWSKSMIRDDQNVLMVAPGDETALVEAINALSDDRKRRERLGHEGRITVERKADIEFFAEQLEGVMMNLVRPVGSSESRQLN